MKTTRLDKTLALTLVAAAALAVAGCTTVGTDFKRPDPLPVQRYTADTLQIEKDAAAGQRQDPHAPQAQQLVPGQPVAPDWWHAFHNAAFDTLVQQALAGNRSLAAAAASLEQAHELEKAQAGTLAPQVGLTAAAGRQKLGAESLGDFSLPPFTYFGVGPTVSYNFDYTGAGRRAVEQKQAQAEYLAHQLDAARLAVAGNTLTQALRIASLRTQIATVDELLQRDRDNLSLVQKAFDAGAVARLDIVSARTQLTSDQALLPPLRQQLSVARDALAVLTGNAPANARLPELDLSAIELPAQLPVSLPSELARRRPDILAAEAQLHASTAAVGVAEGNFYPHITLTASAGQQSSELRHLFDGPGSVFGLGAGLVAPLFDGGTLRAEKRAAVDALHASAASYEHTVLQAFGQVADSLQALEHGAQELQARSGAQDAARENVELARRSYQEGNSGVLQVLDAERRYQQARLGYVQAQGQRYIDTVQLFLALGGAGPGAA